VVALLVWKGDGGASMAQAASYSKSANRQIGKSAKENVAFLPGENLIRKVSQ
jgi:hypothetical protein